MEDKAESKNDAVINRLAQKSRGMELFKIVV